MGINQLIARGGTQIQSPVQRYMETRAQMNQESQNQLLAQQRQQQMGIQQRQEGRLIDAQTQKNKIAFMKTQIPSMQESLLGGTLEEQQALWDKGRAGRMEMAKMYNLPYEEGIDEFNPQASQGFIDAYGEKKKSPYSKVDPSKYTPESIRKFEKSRVYGDLIAVDKQKGALINLSIGEKAVDRAFAKDFVSWTTGGFADVEKNLSQLKSVHKRLGGEENLTGPVLGRTPDIVKAMTHPEAIDVRDEVEEVVQRNLRLILGAQFTQKEGERLIARAYNENLDEAVNKKRVGRLIKAIEDAALAKQAASDYFNEKGTLSGFKGQQFTIDDFGKAIEKDGKIEAEIPSPKTDEEYNKLKSGDIYIDPDDGKQYRKP